MIKLKAFNINYDTTPDTVTDLQLKTRDLLKISNDLADIVVDGTIFNEFKEDSTIKIIWVDGPGNSIYEYQMVEQDLDNNIKMELLDIYDLDDYITNLSIDLDTEMTFDIEDNELDLNDSAKIKDYLTKQIETESNCLVNSFDYKIEGIYND